MPRGFYRYFTPEKRNEGVKTASIKKAALLPLYHLEP